MVIVLIPYTSSAYGKAVHPVGKSYAINIEAEKIGFLEAEQIPDSIGIKSPLSVQNCQSNCGPTAVLVLGGCGQRKRARM